MPSPRFKLESQVLADLKRHLQWTSRPMGARGDLNDKDALFAALDEHLKTQRRHKH